VKRKIRWNEISSYLRIEPGVDGDGEAARLDTAERADVTGEAGRLELRLASLLKVGLILYISLACHPSK
jgi:hypothetical protein